VGGDLSAKRLLLAYDSGIFPWYDEGLPPLWWSPNPRALLQRERLHVSRSMRRVLRQRRFTLSHNAAFVDVITACGERRSTGTWIIPEMVSAYTALHRLGHAHSIEVWVDGQLAGGLYGVQRGGLFAAESMFHRQPNASKIALIRGIESLFERGIQLFDVQFMTPHLASLGAFEISRDAYLTRVAAATSADVDLHGLRL
jgi:leucyl/phenylalanyl-tRNA--protein transferase